MPVNVPLSGRGRAMKIVRPAVLSVSIQGFLWLLVAAINWLIFFLIKF
jgi:hypothetical protein